uniref:Uncharacterized protein n=1 Tax=Melopsittacus undulatus TaxID=13146 RepID=A0A8C6IPX3_MELUD
MKKALSYISLTFSFFSFRHQDVLTVTPWLAPIIWEETFNSEILGHACKPLNLTIGVTDFAIGKYSRSVGCVLESAEKHSMKGYWVNYYIFTDNPETFLMSGCNQDEETSHQEVDYLFCLDIVMVFCNAWGPETLGDTVAAIHPAYFNVPQTAYIPDEEGDSKVCGFTKICNMTILMDKAQKNGIMAAWQEESHLNQHFLFHRPSKVFSPEYVWDARKPKPPEILLKCFSTVDKNYNEIRD